MKTTQYGIITTHGDCPSWCEYESDRHDGNHWISGEYVAASRSRAESADSGGVVMPTVAVHLARGGDSTDVVLHVGGEDDVEVRFSADEAVAFAANLLLRIRNVCELNISAGSPRDVLKLERQAQFIIAARKAPEGSGS